MAKSERFNSVAYLEAWKTQHQFPAIHDDIFNAISTVPGTVLDLCCSTGLLGQRLIEAGRVCVGIDGDRAAAVRAMAYGIKLDIHCVPVSGATFSMVKAIIESHGVEVVAARRCIPELFNRDHRSGRVFAAMLYALNVKHIFLEGRVPTDRAVNSLPTVEAEVALFASHYQLVVLQGRVAHLERLQRV